MKKRKSIGKLIIEVIVAMIQIVVSYKSTFYISTVFADVFLVHATDAEFFLLLPVVLILSLVCLYFVYFFQTIVHECGHLVFGLLSGYKFSSFRVLNLMLVKQGKSLKLKRFLIPGTTGQCLMYPPEIKDGKLPLFWYNLGGSAMNLIISIVTLILMLYFRENLAFSAVMYLLFVWGVMLAMLNAIPMRSGMADNDGYNYLVFSKTPLSRFVFWLELKVNEMTAKGVRVKDMPEEWFGEIDVNQLNNHVIARKSYFVCQRLLDEHKFNEAQELIYNVLNADNKLPQVIERVLICQLLFCELIDGQRTDVIEEHYTKEQKAFMKMAKTYLTVIVTEYAYALLYEKDIYKAQDFKENFEAIAKKYPHPIEVLENRELIEIVDDIGRKSK